MTEYAPYMHWAKTHERVRWELSGSDLLHCTLEDLPGWKDVIELSGPNDDGYSSLTHAIGDLYGVDEDRVCTAAGASGANFLSMAAILEVGDEVLVESPGYDCHEGAARLLGAEVRTFARRFEDEFIIDTETVADELTDRTRLVVITNPYNPGGVMASEEELIALAELAEREGFHVLVDEVYLDCAPESVNYAVRLSDRMVSTSSLTKSYGLSGLRVGWVVTTADLAERMRRVRDVVDATGSFPAEKLAVLAFEQLDRLSGRAQAILAPNRRLVNEFMARYDELLWVPPTGGAVAFPKINGVADINPFLEKLRAGYELGLVSGSFFGAPEHFRIAMGGSRHILERGLDILGEAIESRAWH